MSVLLRRTPSTPTLKDGPAATSTGCISSTSLSYPWVPQQLKQYPLLLHMLHPGSATPMIGATRGLASYASLAGRSSCLWYTRMWGLQPLSSRSTTSSAEAFLGQTASTGLVSLTSYCEGSEHASYRTTRSGLVPSMPWSDVSTTSTLCPAAFSSCTPATIRPARASTTSSASPVSGASGPYMWPEWSGSSKYSVTSLGADSPVSPSHPKALLTRSPYGTDPLYCSHREGRTPRISTSDPGQKKVAALTPCLSAVTHTGSPPSHQKGSCVRIEKRSPGRAGSIMLLATTPWLSSHRPVASV
mmetsp:Transcript_13212/g.45693  ORF Transcript_13212/g.45693 Transcript_13212/m.45693 type:complete len:301 (+) Transcript_13212:139-1041(+)